MSVIDDDKFAEFEDTYNEFWREHGVGGSVVKQDFCEHYRTMLVELRAHRKPDRSALLRMAGNIASGLATGKLMTTDMRQQVASDSIDIARRILAAVDGAKP